MSEKELQKRIRAERQLRKNIPEGCLWPDCFHCVFDDCHYDRNSGTPSRPEPGKTEKKSSDLDGQMDIRDFL